MMLDEHATHTPKSLKRGQEENFFAGKQVAVPDRKNPGAKFDKIMFRRILITL
jgi:hypothetical protein